MIIVLIYCLLEVTCFECSAESEGEVRDSGLEVLVRIDVVQFDEKVGMGTFSSWLKELECEVRVWRADRDELPPVTGLTKVLLLGGYMGVNDRDQLHYLQRASDWLTAVVEQGIPLLAICLGGQLLAYALGAKVHSQYRQERGIREIQLSAAGKSDPLLAGLPQPFLSFEWHNDSFDLPLGAVLLAETAICPGQVFRYRNAWGLQFHPEVNQQVVADWCQRTGEGDAPLEEFCRYQDDYLLHSRLLLSNFVRFGEQPVG